MPIDESTNKSEINFMVKPTRPQPIPVKEVKQTMWPCARCKKITRSHTYPDGSVLCHACFTDMTEEEKNEFAEKHSGRSRKEEKPTV